MSPAPLLEVRGLVKDFPGVRALDGVDLDVAPGEIGALVGENGAGKSTLIKVLAGVHRADAGEVRFEGRPFAPAGPIAAQRSGIATIHQEIDLVGDLSAAENLFLGRLPRRPGLLPRAIGLVDWRTMRERARAAMARLGIEIDVDRPVRTLPVAIQQMVAIARALDLDARLLVMDEPTSSLDRTEVETLFALLRRLALDGSSVLFVGHRLDEILEIAGRVTVLRNGRRVGCFEAAGIDRFDLAASMLGVEAGELDLGRRREPAGIGKEVLRARGLSSSEIEPFDLSLRAGEVVGLSGLLGSGRTELAQLLAGLFKARSGELEIGGRAARLRSPRQGVARGVAYCPEDRRADGLIPNLSVWENVALVVQRRLSRWGGLSAARHKELAARLAKRLGLVAASLDQPVRTLSGGNQQKVILARWLAAEPGVLLLDEPTRGIDVGAKAEIEALVAELAAEGLAVLFISSTLEEVLRISDRVAVLRERRVVAELPREELAEEAVLEAMSGGRSR